MQSERLITEARKKTEKRIEEGVVARKAANVGGLDTCGEGEVTPRG